MKKIDSILQQVLKNIEPEKEDLEIIDKSLKEFLSKFKKRVKAEVFIGGSFAKATVIKKDYYDIDVFVRFDKKDKENVSKLTAKALKGAKNVSIVHGSRDYFRVKISPDFFIEIIPVVKVNKPKEAENITDLSYSHVQYIKKKVKSKKILDEIRIAKAFCYANHCYGAESYINGFSGYGLELLVYHYKSFLKFIRAMAKVKEKEVIDIEKHYKNKQTVLMDLNGSKLISPVILIDPTFKERNVLAALSDETFKNFKKACAKFLKKPSIKAFEIEKTDLEKIEKNAVKNKSEFILIEAKTNKQEGDVAGSKLFKFYNHLEKEISRYFDVKNKGFNYNGKKSARYFFVVKSKGKILCKGPYVKDLKNLKAFEKEHKNYFIKKARVYAKEKVDFSLKEFIGKWKIKNKKRMKEMSIMRL